MVKVKKKPGQSDDALIKLFTNLVRENEIVDEVKRRTFYLKPSQAIKLKRKQKQQKDARIKVV